MKKYDKYKPSGIEWIGEIPEEWASCKMKYMVDTSKYYQIGDGDHGSIKPDMYSIDGDIPYIRVQNLSWNGELVWEGMVYISENVHNSNLKSKIIPNDILIAKTGATIGKLAIIPFSVKEANTTSSVGKITVDSKRFDAKFILYSMMSKYFNDQIWIEASQKSAQPGFNVDDLIFFTLVSPLSQPEQTAIANYLDDKTAKIDTLIEKKKKLIELLKEERTAVINHYVLGQHLLIDNGQLTMDNYQLSIMNYQLPKGWEVKKLAYGFKIIGSGTTPTSDNKEYYCGKINWLQTGDLNDGYINSTSKTITEKALADYPTLRKYSKGSLVIAMYGATIGKTGILNISTTTNQACCVISEAITFYTKYVFWWFVGNKEYIVSKSYGGGQPNISQELIKSLRLPCPPLQEQHQIVHHIEAETKRIDSTISKIEKEISLLQEYRTALISEVVTGKIKVIDN